MTRAFMYDSLCGMVYRCEFAGLDEYGHAQWLNITPGEEPKTLDDVIEDEELGDTRFFFISMSDDEAQPDIIAKVIGKVMECPIGELGADLAFAIKRMKQLGVKWDKEPLELEFRVFENRQGQRKGKYSFWVEDKLDTMSIIADIDNFDDLHELFECIRTYIFALEVKAKIPIITKDLRISDKLRLEARKTDLGMFNNVDEDYTSLS